MDQPQNKLRNVGLLSSLGLVMGASVVVGYFLGDFLDSKLDTKPWLMVTCLTLGLAAGFVEVIQIIKRLQR